MPRLLAASEVVFDEGMGKKIAPCLERSFTDAQKPHDGLFTEATVAE